MQSTKASGTSSMWRPTALIMLLVVAVALGGSYWVAATVIHAEAERREVAEVAGIATRFAPIIEGRLQMADALVRYLTLADAGGGGESLRRRLQGSDSFVGVALVPGSQIAAELPDRAARGSALPTFSAAGRLALAAGQSVLEVVPNREGRADVYLAHEVNLLGSRHIGLFELNPTWLWQSAEELPREVALAVVQPPDRTIFGGAALPPDVLQMFEHASIDERFPHQPSLRHWRQDGQQWRAAVVQIALNSRLAGAPWNVAVLMPSVDAGAQLLSWPLALSLLAVTIAAALFGSHALSRRWQPVLGRLDAALLALGEGTFKRVEIGEAADHPRRVAESYNAALGQLQQRLAAQACLAEIDRLLLEARDLEQTLEAILLRVRTLTGAHASSLALLDRDAPGHARSFTVSGDEGSCPIVRINIDGETLATLREQAQELSVEQHLGRHSFLEPLVALGAGRCRSWPIVTADRIAAILSVGYRSEDAPNRAQLDFGAECAARLQLALSNQERDERLYRQAHFDSLTSLPNRLLFRDRLSQELTHVAETAQRGALLYVDLDHFKQVNDSVGHIAGDQLLMIIAQRLRACVKESDTVARLGGDEFTVILRNVPSAEAAGGIAERIIEALQRPVNIAGRDHQVRASIGITLFPDDGSSIDELMRNADLAMYQAKESGRARVLFFDRKMTRPQLPVADSGLFRALRRREFLLHYQPQFQIRTGALIALEALLRWQSPREGLHPARDFIGAAERSGLIVDIGDWALDTVCYQLAAWREQGIAPARVTVNVSLQQLRLADFAERVHQSLHRAGVPASMIELEITEAALLEEPVRQTLQTLCGLGLRLALDDFGSGSLSLPYLRQHPIDTIKIDRTFMQEVPDSAQASTIAATIIDMAHALGKLVIAEGVETLQQLDFLRTRGCDVAQGFVLSRPLDVTETTSLLAGGRGSELLLRAAG